MNEIDEIDEFAEGPSSVQQPQEPSEPSLEQNNEEGEDLTTEVLRLRGIDDPSKIKFQDESGAIVERDWDTLSRAEQINILSDQGDGSENLDEDEIELLNAIRTSNMDVVDFLQSLQPEPERPSYKIDELSDEDVYVLNLLDTVGSDNITDEELSSQLEVAKQNEGLFKKQVDGLRQKYIQLQQEEEIQQANAVQFQRQQQYDQFANSIQNEIVGMNSFAGRELQLSDEDMDQLARFTLALDDSGMSAFGKALQDPAIFTRAAFWVLNEDEIISELTKQIQDNYVRGYNAGKNDSGSKLVFQPRKQTQQKGYSSINDLDYDEFD